MPWEKIKLEWTKSTKRNKDGRPLYMVSNCPSVEGAPPIYQFYAVPHGRRLFVLVDYLDRDVFDCDIEGDTATLRMMSLRDVKKTAQKVSDWEVRTANALEEHKKEHTTPADDGDNEAAFRKAAEAEDGMPISAGARKAPQEVVNDLLEMDERSGPSPYLPTDPPIPEGWDHV